jgi:hypothetical protein
MNNTNIAAAEMLSRLSVKPLEQGDHSYTKPGRPNTAMGSKPLVTHKKYRAYWIYTYGGTIVAATPGAQYAHGHRVEVRGVGNDTTACEWAAKQHSTHYTD